MDICKCHIAPAYHEQAINRHYQSQLSAHYPISEWDVQAPSSISIGNSIADRAFRIPKSKRKLLMSRADEAKNI